MGPANLYKIVLHCMRPLWFGIAQRVISLEMVGGFSLTAGNCLDDSRNAPTNKKWNFPGEKNHFRTFIFISSCG